MNISNILVAALLLTAGGAAAQDGGGVNLSPGQKTETDGNRFQVNNMSPDEIANNKGVMRQLSGGNPPGVNKSNHNKPGDGKTGGANNPGGDGGRSSGGGGNGGQPGGGQSAASAIKLSGVTGTVHIKIAGGTMIVNAGDPVPEIPSGSEIVVVSGKADVAVGGAAVKAGAGDSFTVATSGSGASIFVTGGLVTVVDANGKSSEHAKGENTTVSTAPSSPKAVASNIRQPGTDAPESIPADSNGSNYTENTIAPVPSSPSQEKAATTSTCVNTVSPSAPCP